MRICKIDKSEMVWGRGGMSMAPVAVPVLDMSSVKFDLVKPNMPNTASSTAQEPTFANSSTSSGGSFNETVALAPMAVACVVGAAGSALGHVAQNRGNVGFADTATAAAFGCLGGVSSTVGGVAGGAYAVGSAIAGSVGAQAALNSTPGSFGGG